MADKDTPEIVKNWDHPVNAQEGTNLYKLLSVLDPENKRLSLDIEEIYDDKFVGTATGSELEKIGNFVGVRRKTDEPDKKLRKRIQAEFASQASDTTYETFSTVALSILEASPSEVTIKTPPETVPKVVELTVDGAVLEESPLTKDEIASLLDRTVSASAKVNLIETGTFAFAGDDSTLEGWNEGTWSSTIK